MSKSWQEMPLGEVLTERQEIPKEQDLLTGNIRIISKIGFNDGKIQLREETNTRTKMILIRPGDLVVSGINAAKGAIAIYGEENEKPVTATIHYGSYIPNKNKVETKYLWWLLRSNTFKELLTRYVPGGIKTELKAKRLLPVPIPLPPLLEQCRIVKKVEAIQKKIESANVLNKQIATGTENILSQIIQKIFNEGMDRNWKKSLLGDYVEHDCYGTSEKASSDEDGIPVLRMGNIQNGRIIFDDLKYLHLNDQTKEKLLLHQGDILINRTNSAELVGKCAVFQGERQFVFASYLIRLKLDTKRADPELVAYYINSPYGRKYFLSEKKQMTGQANVNAKKIKSLPIALPNIEEQKRIVAFLKGIEKKVATLKNIKMKVIESINAMKLSVLDKAFKGELN